MTNVGRLRYVPFSEPINVHEFCVSEAYCSNLGRLC